MSPAPSEGTLTRRSEEHTSELQSPCNLVCRLLLEKKNGSWSTPVSEGKRTIRAVAVDAALNTGEHVRTITIDLTPPSGVTVSYPNGYASASFSVTTNNGHDADVDASSAALERRNCDLINDTSSSYGGWTSATSPDSVAFFFFNDTPSPKIYTLSLHDALPI